MKRLALAACCLNLLFGSITLSQGPIIGFDCDTIEILDSRGSTQKELPVKKLGPPERLVLVSILDTGLWKIRKGASGQEFIVDRGDLRINPKYIQNQERSRAKCRDSVEATSMGIGDCR